MGYWKENFPGSPAALQRSRIAKGSMVYVLIAGGLYYLYSPFSKAFRQAVDEGAWDTPMWMKDNLSRKNPGMSGMPTRKKLTASLENKENIENLDFTWGWMKYLGKYPAPQPPNDPSK